MSLFLQVKMIKIDDLHNLIGKRCHSFYLLKEIKASFSNQKNNSHNLLIIKVP